MKVFSDRSGDFKDGPIQHLHFEEMSNEYSKLAFVYGAGCRNGEFPNRENYNFKVYLDFEEPNRFKQDPEGFLDGERERWDLILSICPYSSVWLNTWHKNKATFRIPVFYPFDVRYIPQKFNKEFDVCYVGSSNSSELKLLVQTIARYKYCYVSHGKPDLVTDSDVSYEDKLSIIARSKISICSNLLYEEYADQYSHIKRIEHYGGNRAFSNLDLGFKPQLKPRVIESAFCRSLILCREDQWNVIEKYFEPNEDFLYFNNEDLDNAINSVLRLPNEEVERITENAFNKAVNNYTTKHFYERFIKPFDI